MVVASNHCNYIFLYVTALPVLNLLVVQTAPPYGQVPCDSGRHNAGEATVKHKVQARSAVQQKSGESPRNGVDSESIPSHRPEDIGDVRQLLLLSIGHFLLWSFPKVMQSGMQR